MCDTTALKSQASATNLILSILQVRMQPHRNKEKVTNRVKEIEKVSPDPIEKKSRVPSTAPKRGEGRQVDRFISIIQIHPWGIHTKERESERERKVITKKRTREREKENERDMAKARKKREIFLLISVIYMYFF